MLTAEEWRLIRRLRDVADGDARRELLGLVAELIDLAGDARCAESQGDGVPCRTVGTASADCQSATGALSDLRRHLRLTQAVTRT
jgi:hypothetical protein